MGSKRDAEPTGALNCPSLDTRSAAHWPQRGPEGADKGPLGELRGGTLELARTRTICLELVNPLFDRAPWVPWLRAAGPAAAAVIR